MELKLIDFNISSLSSGGHYLERAMTLAKYIKDKNKTLHLSLLCDANTDILTDSDVNSIFSSIDRRPGYTTFGGPTFHSSTLYSKRIIDSFKEYSRKFTNPLIHNTQENQTFNGFELILNDAKFLDHLIENVDLYYCALPNQIISFCKYFLALYDNEFADSDDDIKLQETYTSEIFKLWFSVRREEMGFVRSFVANVIDTNLRADCTLLFMSSNITEVLTACMYLASSKVECGKVVFFLHQPNEFTPSNSYQLKRLLLKLSAYWRKNFLIAVASEQFKKYLSSVDFNYIGDHLIVTIGPFFLFNSDVHNLSFESKPLSSSLIERHLIESNVPAWLKLTDKSNNAIANKFRESNFLINHEVIFMESLKNLLISNNSYIAFMGDLRDEKNFLVYSKIVMRLWDLQDDIFSVHPTYFSNGVTETSKQALEVFRSHPSYGVYALEYSSPLNRNEYYLTLDNAKMIFAAYRQSDYAFKQSGVFCEAVIKKCPTIVTAGTSSAVIWSNLLFKISSNFLKDSSKLIDTNIVKNRNQFFSFTLNREQDGFVEISSIAPSTSQATVILRYKVLTKDRLKTIYSGSISFMLGDSVRSFFPCMSPDAYILETEIDVISPRQELNSEFFLQNSFELKIYSTRNREEIMELNFLENLVVPLHLLNDESFLLDSHEGSFNQISKLMGLSLNASRKSNLYKMISKDFEFFSQSLTDLILN